MNIGLDVGYSAVKAVAGNRRVSFPSVVGTPDQARFSLNGTAGGDIILTEPRHVLVGQGAVEQSRFLRRREGRKIGRAYLLNTPARCERVMSLFKNPMIGISPWGLGIALALEGWWGLLGKTVNKQQTTSKERKMPDKEGQTTLKKIDLAKAVGAME
jgi:hypothetical protein